MSIGGNGYGLVDPKEARRRGWGDTVKYKGGEFDRLENILPTLNIAEGWSVSVGECEQPFRAGQHLIRNPGWRQREDEPFDAAIEVGVARDGESEETRPATVGMSWLVFEENGREHTLAGLDIKVDEEGTLYALGRYASLAARSECRTCHRVIVCGVNPYCW